MALTVTLCPACLHPLETFLGFGCWYINTALLEQLHVSAALFLLWNRYYDRDKSKVFYALSGNMKHSHGFFWKHAGSRGFISPNFIDNTSRKQQSESRSVLDFMGTKNCPFGEEAQTAFFLHLWSLWYEFQFIIRPCLSFSIQICIFPCSVTALSWRDHSFFTQREFSSRARFGIMNDDSNLSLECQR